MRRRPALAVALAAIALVSCSTSAGVSTVEVNDIGSSTGSAAEPDATGSGGDDPASGTIEWGACEASAISPVDLECGSLSVPLDYSSPDGQLIEIAVARVATTDDDERIGSLVFNPGGPGGSGIEFLQSAALIMPAELNQRFDLVSFDPRGVGASAAVECEFDQDDAITLLEEGDDAGWNALVAEAEARPSTCTADSGELAPWTGTNNAARDLDALRSALGDDRLSYVGFSYGTRLGATYAHLFPERVRALVLDGAVKPTTDSTEIVAGQAGGLDRAFERFAASCDADSDCDLRDVGPTLDVYTALVASVGAAGSVPTDDPDRVLTAGELQLGVIAALYNTQLWPVLARGLADASVDGDGTLLQVLADTYLGRQPDGSYDNSQEAGFAINCADDPIRPPAEVIRVDADEVAATSQWFDDFLRASTGCLGASPPVDPLIIGSAEGAPPILVIGTTGDPATPYEWAVELADSLASAELYTVEADGHTAFLSAPCVEPVVVDYLVDLTMPAPDSSCTNDVAADAFPPSGDSDFDKVVALFDCLRENGADVPEVDIGDVLSDPTGQRLFEEIDPTDPAFGDAALACQDLIADL